MEKLQDRPGVAKTGTPKTGIAKHDDRREGGKRPAIGSAGDANAGLRQHEADGRDADDWFPLKKLEIGQKDKRGRVVRDILWTVPEFRIYKTDYGISPHFSDLKEEAREQREQYLAIGEYLSRVNHILHSVPFKQFYFEREVARAIAQALSGQREDAIKTLVAVRERAENWRAAYGKITYLAVCFTFTAALVAIYLYHTANSVDASELWLVTAAGSLGALLSTSINLRGLDIDVDSTFTMAYVSGVIRMLIGIIGAIVVYLTIKAGLYETLFSTLGGISGDVAAAPNAYQIAFLSILAGFSERLVPDVLNRAAGETSEKDRKTRDSEPGDGDDETK